MTRSRTTGIDATRSWPLLLALAGVAWLAVALGSGDTRAARGAGPLEPDRGEAAPAAPLELSAAPAPEGERERVVPGPADGAPQGVLATLVARVATPAGEPVGRATLLLRHGARVVERRALDGTGPARFAGLAPGRYSLELEAESLPPGLLPVPDAATGTLRVPCLLAGGRTGACTLLAVRAACLRGSVLDPEGAPVAGARIRLQDTDATREVPGREAESDERGAFLLEDVLPGTYRARIDWPRGARGTAPPPSLQRLEAGAELALEIRAEAEPRDLAGQLLDEDGQPLAGQLVRGEWCEEPQDEEGPHPLDEHGPPAPWSLVLAETRTDGEGRYRLEGLPPGTVRVRWAPRLGASYGFGPHGRVCEERLSPPLDLAAGPASLDLGATTLRLRPHATGARAGAPLRASRADNR